jgi:hypothetical protein
VTRISPSNHANAVLVHEPAISLASVSWFNRTHPASRKAYEDANADGSVEIRKFLRDIVLRSVKKCEGQCANQHCDIEIGNPS